VRRPRQAQRRIGLDSKAEPRLQVRPAPDGLRNILQGVPPRGRDRVGTAEPYGADFLKNYEVGWKTTWADNHLRFNGALFYETWNNFQFSFLGPNSVTIVANAAQAQVKGLETELEWAVGNG